VGHRVGPRFCIHPIGGRGRKAKRVSLCDGIICPCRLLDSKFMLHASSTKICLWLTLVTWLFFRPFITNLLPCIARISIRVEDAIQVQLKQIMFKNALIYLYCWIDRLWIVSLVMNFESALLAGLSGRPPRLPPYCVGSCCSERAPEPLSVINNPFTPKSAHFVNYLLN